MKPESGTRVSGHVEAICRRLIATAPHKMPKIPLSAKSLITIVLSSFLLSPAEVQFIEPIIRCLINERRLHVHLTTPIFNFYWHPSVSQILMFRVLVCGACCIQYDPYSDSPLWALPTLSIFLIRKNIVDVH